MFLNGACRSLAVDIQATDSERTAMALYDLLMEVLAFPDQWTIGETIDPEKLAEAVRAFDLQSLRDGQLLEGLNGLPMRHVVTDIHSPQMDEGSIDLISSRAVLEHFLDLPQAAERLFELMSPGGLAYHHIDIVDHRIYSRPGEFHAWSFLAEGDDWSDALVNRLRPSEIRRCFEKAGFDVVEFFIRSGVMADGFAVKIHSRFNRMPVTDLSATGVMCVIRRP